MKAIAAKVVVTFLEDDGSVVEEEVAKFEATEPGHELSLHAERAVDRVGDEFYDAGRQTFTVKYTHPRSRKPL